MTSRNDLHPYQNRMIDFIYNTPKCAVWAGLGLGKTITTLTAITDLLDSLTVLKVLIIAPLRVANSVWHTEAKRWAHTKDLTFSIVTGSEKERISALFKSADIYVINRENVQWLVEHYKTKWPYDLVVIDESSSFKSASSQRFKALKKVRTLTDRMVQLTGTPSPNGLIDIWSQMFLLDGGERLGKTMSAYKMRFFQTGHNGYTLKPVNNADKIIHRLIDNMVISLNVDDYLQMPERIDTVMRVNMPLARLAEYKQLERDFIMQINDAEIVAYNAATLAGKLLQYCNGAMYTDELKNWTEIHTAKLDALDEILEDNQDENLLIAYNYKTDLIRLKARYPDAVLLDNDPDIITRWNNGQIKMLLAHPACLHPSTEVLTEFRGWIKIVDVRINERVYDGVEFVSHKGCHFSGIKPVINKFGITLTPNHKLLINNEWVEAKYVRDCESIRRKAIYTYTGNDSYLGEMLPLRSRERNTGAELTKKQSTKEKTLRRLYSRYFSQYDGFSNLENLETYERPLNKYKSFRFKKLCLSRGRNIGGMVEIREFLSGYVCNLFGRFNDRPNRQQQRILQRKLSLGDTSSTTGKQKEQSCDCLYGSKNTLGRILQSYRNKQRCDNSQTQQRNDWRRSSIGLSKINIRKGDKQTSKVYDLVDCGKRNRFLIRNENGDVFISHNSAGHGLNLQHGGSIIVWFGLNWSLELYQQFNGRLHRQGQIKPVRIVHIIADGCIDDKVMRAIENKAQTQDELLNALKMT